MQWASLVIARDYFGYVYLHVDREIATEGGGERRMFAQKQHPVNPSSVNSNSSSENPSSVNHLITVVVTGKSTYLCWRMEVSKLQRVMLVIGHIHVCLILSCVTVAYCLFVSCLAQWSSGSIKLVSKHPAHYQPILLKIQFEFVSQHVVWTALARCHNDRPMARLHTTSVSLISSHQHFISVATFTSIETCPIEPEHSKWSYVVFCCQHQASRTDISVYMSCSSWMLYYFRCEIVSRLNIFCAQTSFLCENMVVSDHRINT